MVYSDGMQMTQYRTTFSFDRTTMFTLKNLAARWRVSQAEVVRRALEFVNQNESLGVTSSPLSSLEQYQKTGSLVREEAERYLQTTRDDRKSWRKT
jgi:hypothetical protein